MALNATVIALTLAGLVGTSVGLRRATLARTQADQNADEARKAEFSARVAQTNALRQAYSASMLSASDALERAQIDTARHYLDGAPADLRGWEWRHLASRLDLTTLVQDHPGTELSQVQVLPDGLSLLFASRYTELVHSPIRYGNGPVARGNPDGPLLSSFLA